MAFIPARRQAMAYSLNAGSTTRTEDTPRLRSTRASAWMSSLLPLPTHEAGGVHPMMPGRREHGFLGMGEG